MKEIDKIIDLKVRKVN